MTDLSLSGVLQIRSPDDPNLQCDLGLHSVPQTEDVEAVRSQSLPKGKPLQFFLKIDGTEVACAILKRSVAMLVRVDDQFIARQYCPSSTREGTIELGPVVLPKSGLDDFIGCVEFKLALETDQGVTVTLWTDQCFLVSDDSEDSRRLVRMMEALRDQVEVLTAADTVTALTKSKTQTKAGNSSRRRIRLSDYRELIGRILQVYAQQHRFFEKSARFQLQHHERMTAIARVEAVTYRTLEFIANHPEELMPVKHIAGIRFRGKSYFPRRTVDETHQKTFDIFENRSLIAFLRTILLSVETLEQSFASKDQSAQMTLFHNTVASAFRSRGKLQTQLRRHIAAYLKLFAIDPPPALKSLPAPTPIFMSSVPYRQIYELMRQWFSAQAPTVSEIRFLLKLSQSSRLYEHYVLLQPLTVFGGTTEIVKRRIHYADAPKQYRGTDACNVYTFFYRETEITLYYEPFIPAGTSQIPNEVGLVRTMTFEFFPSGYPIGNTNSVCWTPDFVIRLRNETGTRYWLADAKYSTWPTVVRNYAQEVLMKYLLATAPRNPDDRICGLMLFCGKDQGADPTLKSLRNVDCLAQRNQIIQFMTLSAKDEILEQERLRAWVMNTILR